MNTRTQIIATIGPKTIEHNALGGIVPLITHARLNFSWGTHKQKLSIIKALRDEEAKIGKKLSIMADLSGPRVQETDGHVFNERAIKTITEKDIVDLEFILKNDIDRVALSYVGDASDVLELRDHMTRLGKVIPIVAKIERKVALENVERIAEVADEVMVARGDLGNEFPLEYIPFAQKRIIEVCNKRGKPVYVATQMMLSMTHQNTPTRAEVTDVTYAILLGANGVMLSEETASGDYPVEAVTMMDRIITETEKQMGK